MLTTLCSCLETIMQTVSSQAFNQNPTAVKRSANKEPVRITERGKVSHILMSINDYEAITGQSVSIVDMLAMPDEVENVDFEKMNASSIKPVEFD